MSRRPLGLSALDPLQSHRLPILDDAEHRGVALEHADDVHGAHGLLAEEQTNGPARRPVADRAGGHHRLRRRPGTVPNGTEK